LKKFVQQIATISKYIPQGLKPMAFCRGMRRE
jgi:hypothetical protein